VFALIKIKHVRSKNGISKPKYLKQHKRVTTMLWQERGSVLNSDFVSAFIDQKFKFARL